MIIKTNAFNPDDIEKNGNKFIIGNGYMGYRGTLDEFRRTELVAINLPNFYDTVPGKWTESINAPNPFYTYVEVKTSDSITKLHPLTTPIISHKQGLIIDEAVHFRNTVYQTQQGQIQIKTNRFVSSKFNLLLGMDCEISSTEPCEIRLYTGIDKAVWDQFGPHLMPLKTSGSDGYLQYVTKTQEKETILTIIEKINYENNEEIVEAIIDTDELLMHRIDLSLKPGVVFRFTKLALISYEKTIDQSLLNLSYEQHLLLHRNNFKQKFNEANIIVEGDDLAQLGISYSIYHLLILAPRDQNYASIPARGVSGQVYKGAIFWDTEIFMIPFFLLTNPEVAQSLLKYRLNSLTKAKQKAQEFGYQGAFYPWESIEDGVDACSLYNVTCVFTKRPLRTYFKDKQIHISSAIAYALDQYYQLTGDETILSKEVLEVFYEIARFYYSRLYYHPIKDLYVITDVTGPDEYHERVDNNAYTNQMVKFSFATFIKYFDQISTLQYIQLPDQMKEFKLIISNVIDKLYIPKPNEHSVIEQFDGYFKLEDLSIASLKSRQLHPNEYLGGAWGIASSTQIIKQADVITLLWLYRKLYPQEVLKANYQYYLPRTLHSSSLSACMYGLVASRIGKIEDSYRFFLDSALIDYEGKGTKYAGGIYIGGTHPASSGGAYMLMVWGFAGVELENGQITVKPNLPPSIKGLHFKIKYQGKIYKIDIHQQDVKVEECIT